jgi:hypothetical protein
MNPNFIFASTALVITLGTIGYIVLGRRRQNSPSVPAPEARPNDPSDPRRPSSTGPEASPTMQPMALPVSNLGDAQRAAELAAMLARPEFLSEPVFRREDYLRAFATGFFRHFLRQSDELELIERIHVLKPHAQIATLRAGHLGFWAIDLDVQWRGVSGKQEFVSRVREPIRRPPPGLAGVALEQHVLAKGVVTIQIEDESQVVGEYQVCKLRTIGWYVAALMVPRTAT